MFLTVLSLTGPGGVISAGIVVLAGTLLHYSARRGSQNEGKRRLSAKEANERELKQKILVTTELMKELERRETSLQNWFEKHNARLERQKSQIVSLLSSAGETASRLEKMVDSFEQTFFASNSSQSSVASIFGELESNADQEIQRLEQSTSQIRIDSGRFDEISNQTSPNAVRSDQISKRTSRTPSPEARTASSFSQASSSVLTESRRQIQTSSKRNASSREIVGTLQTDDRDVENVLGVFKQARKVA